MSASLGQRRNLSGSFTSPLWTSISIYVGLYSPSTVSRLKSTCFCYVYPIYVLISYPLYICIPRWSICHWLVKIVIDCSSRSHYYQCTCYSMLACRNMTTVFTWFTTRMSSCLITIYIRALFYGLLIDGGFSCSEWMLGIWLLNYLFTSSSTQLKPEMLSKVAEFLLSFILVKDFLPIWFVTMFEQPNWVKVSSSHIHEKWDLPNICNLLFRREGIQYHPTKIRDKRGQVVGNIVCKYVEGN